MRFGGLPQVLPNFMSYALLRLEINVRASTIIGAVGGGGIGQELKLSDLARLRRQDAGAGTAAVRHHLRRRPVLGLAARAGRRAGFPVAAREDSDWRPANCRYEKRFPEVFRVPFWRKRFGPVLLLASLVLYLVYAAWFFNLPECHRHRALGATSAST